MIDFIPYKEALALKELGFDEPCYAEYWKSVDSEEKYDIEIYLKGDLSGEEDEYFIFLCDAPTYSQAFRFFREKYKLKGDVKHAESNGSYTYTIWKWNFDNSIGKWERIGVINSWSTYEEAELECLKKLISVVS